MGRITISIVVPTINRPTLSRTLQSVVSAGISSDDEVIVVWGDRGDPTSVVSGVDMPCRKTVLMARAPRPDYGNTQRTAGMRAATCSHIAFMDDDDIYLVGAIHAMKQELQDKPDTPHHFQVNLGPPLNRQVWRTKQVKVENVSTIGIVVPNVPNLPVWPVRRPDGKLTPWGEGGNDAVFACEVERTLGRFVFSDTVVARSRPD